MTIQNNNNTSKNVDHNPDFNKALELMNSDAPFIYITGKAGSGKSTLLRHFKTQTNKHYVVLAPTGIAALNVEGQTLHSFFKFPSKYINPTDIRCNYDPKYKLIDTIIIDEASMVRVDWLQNIDRFLRLNGRDKNKPFGGCQMILIGDLFQLPPVSQGNEKKFLEEKYRSLYFFDAPVLQELEIQVVELQKVYRQNPDEQEFIRCLNEIRSGQGGEAELALFNRRQHDTFYQDGFITLCATNNRVNELNRFHLEQLDGEEYMFHGHLTGEFKSSNCLADVPLKLKPGAQVMFVRNDADQRWVNGSVGTVAGLHRNSIAVQTPDGNVHEVGKVRWDMFDYQAAGDTLTTKTVGSLTHYPLKLAWAITIHKSQGQTLEKVIVDTGNGAFAHGQTYVALSRAKSLKGLVLRNKLTRKDVIVDQRIVDFMRGANGQQPSSLA